MAGGKETPRQKMIGMMYLVLTALLALNVSKSILDAFVAIEENTQISNISEYSRGEVMKAELRNTSEDKTEAQKAEKAKKMLAVIEEIDALAAARIKEIDDLKIEILTTVGEDMNTIITKKYEESDPLRPTRMDLSQVQSSDKYDEPMHILIGEDITKPTGKGLTLYENLKTYRKELTEKLATYTDGSKKWSYTAPDIVEFEDITDLTAQVKESIESQAVEQDDKDVVKSIYIALTKQERSEVHGVKGVHWVGKTFDHSPVVAAMASLSSLQTEVLSTRANAVERIRKRVGGGEYNFNKIMPLAYGPEVVNSGDDVEIEVLMAAFDSDKQPKVMFTMDTTSTEMTAVPDSLLGDGKGRVRFKATGGTVNLKGTVAIQNKSGVWKTREWKKTISVTKPSGTVSLPELNVLYRGYANKVEGAASGYASYDLRGSGVSLKKSGQQYIASPGSGRECTISIVGKNPDGSSANLGAYKFRVSNLPAPTIKFGSLWDGDEAGSSTMKSNTTLFAKYPPEIPLEAKFSVKSWEVSVSGAPRPEKGNGSRLSPRALSLIKQAKSGSLISFMTRVTGPDGKTRKKGATFKMK